MFFEQQDDPTARGAFARFAMNCKSLAIQNSGLSDAARGLISNSLSDASKRAYAADLVHFESTGRQIPATPEGVASYLAEGVEEYAMATLQRRLAALSKAHKALGTPDPTKSELVRATIRGARRAVGIAQKQAPALLVNDLVKIVSCLGNRPKDIRDKALLLVGYSGAFRRSELVALNHEDLNFTARGLLLVIRRSKTDQVAAGRELAIPFGRPTACPVLALQTWLRNASISEGALFKVVNRHDQISDRRMSGEAVAMVLRKRAEEAGVSIPNLSAHSLRSGLITSAALAGASVWKIRQQSGHSSETMVSRYVRSADLFEDNAAARVL
jgi:integrase